MEESKVKTDCNGWEYYDRLPQGYRLGGIEDFHSNGKKKVGMEYLIQRADQQYFEVHMIIEETRSKNLKPFFDWDMIFVKM